jgi:hypothetical protein
MAQAVQKFDYVVFGADLTGILIAQELSGQGAKVLLVDEAEVPGQKLRAIKNEFGQLSPLMNCFPQTSNSQVALDFFEQILKLKAFRPDHAMTPVTYENGALKNFIGFGANPPSFYPEILPYLSAQYYRLTLDFENVLQHLLDQKTFDFLPRTSLTKIELESEKMTTATLNGHKKIHAENFIYTLNLKSLSLLLKDLPLSTKVKNKLSKGPYLSTLRVDLFFTSQLCEIDSLHVLNGTTQDEIGPNFGIFHPATEVGQSSQWLTYLESQEAEESEYVGEAIKKIKRQIKRAYPASSSVLKKERISLFPYEAGGDEQFLPNNKFNEIENFWVAHPQLNPEKGPFAGIAQALSLLQKLGFAKETAAQTTEFSVQQDTVTV